MVCPKCVTVYSQRDNNLFCCCKTPGCIGHNPLRVAAGGPDRSEATAKCWHCSKLGRSVAVCPSKKFNSEGKTEHQEVEAQRREPQDLRAAILLLGRTPTSSMLR